MDGSIEIFRFPRRRPALIFCLATIFMLAALVEKASPAGVFLVLVFACSIAAFGLSQWLYVVMVGPTSIEVGSFKRKIYELADARAIIVRRVKGGRTGAVEFQGSAPVFIDGGINQFDDLLALIGSRASLPVTKPVWDP
jgi:hypothetical protein